MQDELELEVSRLKLDARTGLSSQEHGEIPPFQTGLLQVTRVQL